MTGSKDVKDVNDVSSMTRNPLLYLAAGIIGLSVAGSRSDAQPALPPINGSVSFAGIAKLNGPLASATAFTNFNPVHVVGAGPGNYTNLLNGTPASWKPFIFNPASDFGCAVVDGDDEWRDLQL